MRKEFQVLGDEVKRKISATQVMSTVVNANGYTGGIRFMRSGATTGAQNSTTGTSNNNTTANSTTSETSSSVHKQMADLRE